MSKKVKRLHEEELVNEMAPVAPAQPAAPAEVEAAQPVEAAPVEAVEEVPVEPQPVEDAPVEAGETFTPPAPGLVPAWIDPAIFTTGDLEVAEEVPAANEEVVTPMEEPLVAEETQQVAPAEPEVVIESITREELEVIQEYRRYKTLNSKISKEELDIIGKYREYKALEENKEDEAKLTDLSIGDDADEAAKAGTPDVDIKLEKVSLKDVVNSMRESEDEELPVEDLLEDLPEGDDLPLALSSDNMYDIGGDEDDDILTRVEDLLAGFESYEGSSDIPEVLRSVADFLDEIVEEDPEDEEDPEVEADEVDNEVEVEDDLEVEDEEDDFEEEDIRESVRRVSCSVERKNKLVEDIIYPAGTTPNPELPSSESNLIRSYEKTQAKRREALRAYRENTQRVRSDKFREALNASSKPMQESVVDPNSWSANKFFEKYKESREFSFNDLLKNGFLG